MSTIEAFLLVVTVLSFVSGLIRLSFWWHGLAVVVALACIAWLTRYQLIMTGDVTLAEDYSGDLTLGFATLEIAVAIIWLSIIHAIGHLAARIFRPADVRG